MYFLLVAVVLSSGPGREAARRSVSPGTPTGVQAQLTDAEVQEQARALLGAIDTPISAAQWKALGPRAEPMLAALVDDDSELPTRRARAIDALVTVGGDQTRARFARVAEGEGQPLVVRLAAVHGLGAIVPATDLPVVLGKLLTKAPDSRVRAATGEVLALKAKGKAACSAVEAQVQREGAAGRAQFHRAAKTCGLDTP